MKRLLVALLLLSSMCFGQSVQVLDRAIQYGSLAPKAYFILPNNQGSILLSIHNNGAGTNVVNFSAYFTLDPTATMTAAGLTADKKWAPIPSFGKFSTSNFDVGQLRVAAGAESISLATGDTQYIQFAVPGASVYGVKFDNGSGVQTADILYNVSVGPPGANFQPVSWFWNVYQARYEVVQGTKGMGQVVSRGIEFASLGSHTYAARTTTTNPGINAQLLNVGCNGGCNADANIYQLVLSSTAVAQVDIIMTSVLGSTCTAVTPQNLAAGANASVITASKACTTPPTTIAIAETVLIPANGSVVVDMSGYILFGSGTGISLQTPAAVTGVVTASLRWAETQP